MRNIFSILLTLLICQISIAQTKYNTGMDFDEEAYSLIPKKAKLTRSLDAVPASASLKMYAPIPGNQGMYGTCTSWAVAYCGKTIVEAVRNNWTDKKIIIDNTYSPAFLFRMLKPTDNTCVGGSFIGAAFEIMKDKGALRFNELSVTCTPSISQNQITQASQSKIKDYMRLFDSGATSSFKTQSVKKSISEKKPVVFGMICPPTFMNVKDLWIPTEAALESYGGHALCVVGYDDQKFGGAFEIQNSWGTNWGNLGYCWIKYDDFAKFTKYAYEFVDLAPPKPQVPDLSGSIKLTLAGGTNMPVNLLQSTRGLKVVSANTVPGSLSMYKTADTYSSGTKFRIYISNNEPAYVYAISTDLSNEITKIFPYQEGISAALTDKKNDIAIPDEDHFIEFDNKRGKDFLCVLYSRDELDLNGLVEKIGSQQGSFSEKIFKVLGEKMVDPKDIQFSKDKIAFQGHSRGKSIIPMMVELEHQ